MQLRLRTTDFIKGPSTQEENLKFKMQKGIKPPQVSSSEFGLSPLIQGVLRKRREGPASSKVARVPASGIRRSRDALCWPRKPANSLLKETVTRGLSGDSLVGQGLLRCRSPRSGEIYKQTPRRWRGANGVFHPVILPRPLFQKREDIFPAKM